METEDFKGFNLLSTSPMEFDGNIQETPEIPGALGEVTKDEDPKEESTEIKDKRTSKEDTFEIKHVDSIEDVKEEEKDEESEESEEATKKNEQESKTIVDTEDVGDDEEATIFKTLATEFSDKGLLAELGEDFEDSEDGFAALLDKTVEDKVEAYKESLPKVAKDFIDFVKAGGDPQQFVQSQTNIDYSRIDPDRLVENEAAQKEIVYNLLVKEGYDADEISEEIADYEDGGLLANKAKRALRKMQSYQQKEQADMLERQKQEATAAQERQAKMMEDLKKDIKSREEIAGFGFKNERQKDEFYDYITKVDRKTGKTQLQLANEADPDAQLKMAWLYFNNFNFSKVEKKAKTKATSELKSKLERATDATSRLKSKRKTSSPDDTPSGDFSGFTRLL